MPSTIDARPLRDIVRDLEVYDVPVSKKLAEEAIAAVAADGLITKDELDRLEDYGDGVSDWRRERRAESKAWKQGTEVGRALLNSLADAAKAAYQSAEKAGRLATVPNTPAFNPWNPWSYWGLTGAPSKGAPVTRDELVGQVRAAANGWFNASAENLVAKYPKAIERESTSIVVPKPEVRRAIEALRQEWLAGRVEDGALSAGLVPLLEQRYR